MHERLSVPCWSTSAGVLKGEGVLELNGGLWVIAWWKSKRQSIWFLLSNCSQIPPSSSTTRGNELLPCQRCVSLSWLTGGGESGIKHNHNHTCLHKWMLICWHWGSRISNTLHVHTIGAIKWLLLWHKSVLPAFTGHFTHTYTPLTSTQLLLSQIQRH